MNNSTWQLDEPLKTDYIQACHDFTVGAISFDEFKMHPAINCIVENSTEEWANQVRGALGGACTLAGYTPNQVRYWYTWHLIKELCNLDEVYEFVEIGGGYGGMHTMSKQFFDLVYYTIFDLPQACGAQMAYAKASGIDSHFLTKSVIPARPHNYNLCIAWCSWSELDLYTRIEYLEKVIAPADHIFMGVNWDFAGNLKLIKKYIPDVKVYADPHLGQIIYK